MMDNFLEKRSRGFITNEDIIAVSALSATNAEALLHSHEPWQRTAAVAVLSQKASVEDMDFAHRLLTMLQNEKALYTRLMLCEVLSQGNLQTATQICGYLGLIGNNQLKTPEPPSKKKSYPLPRDLAARILGKMHPIILPALIDVLTGVDIIKISEAIDAYGFLIFYNPGYAYQQNAEILFQLLKHYESNSLLVFKCAIGLSAFPLGESLRYLKQLKAHTDENIRLAAARSFSLLTKQR